MKLQQYNHDYMGGCIVGGDKYTYYPELWTWFVENFTLKNVLDVGCGEGHALRYFKALKCNVIGIEGLSEPIKSGSEPIIKWDLTKGALHIGNIDFVWCCEVLEHIEEKYINNIMETLSAGKIIAITHALPGQTGYHHVNCQNSEYWISIFKSYGFTFLEKLSIESRKLVNASFSYGYNKTGLIFKKEI